MARGNDNTLGKMAQQVIAGDPVLRERMVKVMDRIMREVEYTLKYGSSADKNALMRTVWPFMMQAMVQVDTDAASNDEREAWNRMRLLLTGQDDGSS